MKGGVDELLKAALIAASRLCWGVAPLATLVPKNDFVSLS